MKRILFMHHVSSIGGGSYCLLNILKNIDLKNIEPIVCLASEGPLKNEIEKYGIKVIIFRNMHVIPYNESLFKLRSIKAYYKIKQSFKSFKTILENNKIDVVYLNNMMLYRYLLPAKQCNCRTILHCREHWPLNEHCIQLGWARNAVGKYADRFVAINRFSASMFPNKSATIVYDWIDMDSRYEYRPMDDILGEDSANINVYLYTGGYQKLKGCLEVLSAFSECVKNTNARLLTLGVNPKMKVAKYKLLLAKVGIKCYTYRVLEIINRDNRIHCIPSTYMISHIIQQCYCNLSYFTMPHANLALAECEILGVPSIAAETDESREYSLDGLLSCLYKINSQKAFRSAVKVFDSNYEYYKRNICEKSYTLKQMFDRQYNVERINNLLANV